MDAKLSGAHFLGFEFLSEIDFEERDRLAVSGVRRIFRWGDFKSDIKNLFAIYTLANKPPALGNFAFFFQK